MHGELPSACLKAEVIEYSPVQAQDSETTYDEGMIPDSFYRILPESTMKGAVAESSRCGCIGSSKERQLTRGPSVWA